jgi:hypothetical protein
VRRLLLLLLLEEAEELLSVTSVTASLVVLEVSGFTSEDTVSSLDTAVVVVVVAWSRTKVIFFYTVWKLLE